MLYVRAGGQPIGFAMPQSQGRDHDSASADVLVKAQVESAHF